MEYRSFLFIALFFAQAIYCQEHPDGHMGGTWEVVVPERGGGARGKSLGMQTVHSALLPSGEVLVTSGSSWRNRGPIQSFPSWKDPNDGDGIFRLKDDPFHMDKIEDYFQLVNTAGVYNPRKNTFFRVPHPAPVPDPEWPNHFVPSDMFCTGHLHVPDGNVLFIGGTQYYDPYRSGHRSTYLYDWRKHQTINWTQVDWRQMPNMQDAKKDPKNPWIFAGENARELSNLMLMLKIVLGLLERGRWYPTLVPLLDGRIVVIAGFVGFDPGYEDMYPFQNNELVEFFDPAAFDNAAATNGDIQSAWRYVSVKNTRFGPFTTLINPQFKAPTPDMGCGAKCIEDNQYDVFKLYEQAYLLTEKRIYLTREGDWVSARTRDTTFMRRTKETYYMYVEGDRTSPLVTFSPGPQRAENITSYGTTFKVPNTDRILLLGGQPVSAGTQLYNKDKTPAGKGKAKRMVL